MELGDQHQMAESHLSETRRRSGKSTSYQPDSDRAYPRLPSCERLHMLCWLDLHRDHQRSRDASGACDSLVEELDLHLLERYEVVALDVGLSHIEVLEFTL